MAQKQLNKNLVLALTLVFFGMLIVGSVAVIRQMAQRDPQTFVQLAEQSAGYEDWTQAALWYKRAYQIGEDPQYLVPLGEMRLKDGEVGEAIGIWQEALVNRPDLLEAHRRLLAVRVALAEMGATPSDWREIAAAADRMLALESGLSVEDRAMALHARGTALTQLAAEDPAHVDRGLADLTEAVELSPYEVDYSLDLASALITHRSPESAAEFLLELQNREDQSAGARARATVAHARLLASGFLSSDPVKRTSDIRRAEELFNAAIALAEGDQEAAYDARVALGEHLTNVYHGRGERRKDPAVLEQAQSTLREAVEILPDQYEAYVQLATIFKVAQRPAEQVAVCDQRLERGINRLGVEGPRNRVFAFRLMLLASEGCVELARTSRESGDTAARDDWLAKATAYLERATGEFPNHPRAIAQAGRIKLAEGNERAALAELRRADERFEAMGLVDWETKLELARLHLKLREPGAAKSVLEDSLARARRANATGILLLFVHILVENQEWEDPRIDQILTEVLLRNPDHAEARQLQAAVLERKGRVRQAVALVQEGPSGALLRAKDLAQQGDTEGALSALLKGLEEHPADARLLSVAVAELVQRNRNDEAQALMERAREVRPDDPSLEGLALAIRRDLSEEERREAFVRILEAEEDGLRRSWGLADVYARFGMPEKAEEYLARAQQHLLAKDTPEAEAAGSAQLRSILLARLMMAHRTDKEAVLDEVAALAREHNVDGAGGRTIVGLVHMFRGENDRAILAFSEAVKRQETDVDTLTNLGICLQRTGDTPQAVTYLERAIRVNPAAAVAHKALAAIYKQSGNSEKYEQHLAVAARLLPADPWVREEMLVLGENERPLEAIRQREQKLAVEPNDPANLYRLAVLYEMAGDLDQAEERFEQLLSLRPDDKELVIAASRFYRRTQQPDKSLATIDRFVERQSSPQATADAMVLRAGHHLALGDMEKAEQTLLAAAETSSTFEVCRSLGEFYVREKQAPEKALEWLDRAAEIGSAEDAAGLQDLLAARLTYALYREGEKDVIGGYLDDYARRFPSDPRALLWRADLLASDGRFEEAAAALSDYLRDRPDSPYALYRRSSFYEVLGRMTAAVEDLEAIRRVEPLALDLAPRLRLADLYRRLGREEAWIRELESLLGDAPASVPAAEALARAYLEVGRVADAERLVTSQVNQAEVGEGARWYSLRSGIALRAGQGERALRDAQQAAELSGHDAQAIGLVLDVCLQAGRPTDAVAYAEQHRDTVEQSAVLQGRYARALAKAGREGDAVTAFRRAMQSAVGENAASVRQVTGDIVNAYPAPAQAAALFAASQPAAGLERANERILSRLRHMTGELDLAEGHLERLLGSVNNDQERADLLASRGDLHQSAGRWEAAVQSYEEALRYDPQNWIALNNVAYILADRLDRAEPALPYAERAVRLNANADTWDTLGWIRARLGDYRQAVADLRRSLRQNPALPLTYYHLGETLRRDRRFREALDILTQGRDLAEDQQRQEALGLLKESIERAEREESGA